MWFNSQPSNPNLMYVLVPGFIQTQLGAIFKAYIAQFRTYLCNMIIVKFVSCTGWLFSKVSVLPYDGLSHSSLEQYDHCPRAPTETAINPI